MSRGCRRSSDGGVEGCAEGRGGSKGKMRILGILELIWSMEILEALMELATPESKQLAQLAIPTTLAYLNSQRKMGKSICGMAILETLKEPAAPECNHLQPARFVRKPYHARFGRYFL